jgi:hypothetical protein
VQEEYTKRDGSKGFMPKNIGQAPVMRKGFSFEMHLTMRMDSLTGYVEASAIEDHIQKGEEIEKPGFELAQRLLTALDGTPPPEPTEQDLKMRALLDEFYNMAPATYDRIPNWETMALRKALDIPSGSLPQAYSDDDVYRMELYVSSKKTSKAS